MLYLRQNQPSIGTSKSLWCIAAAIALWTTACFPTELGGNGPTATDAAPNSDASRGLDNVDDPSTDASTTDPPRFEPLRGKSPGRLCDRSEGTFTPVTVEPSWSPEDMKALFRLYCGIFDRHPDDTGFAFWMNDLVSERLTIVELAGIFVSADPGSEFHTQYIQAHGNAPLSNNDFVRLLHIVAQDQDVEVPNPWTVALDGGEARGTVALGICSNPATKAKLDPLFVR